jgi:hypothetical protein
MRRRAVVRSLLYVFCLFGILLGYRQLRANEPVEWCCLPEMSCSACGEGSFCGPVWCNWTPTGGNWYYCLCTE